MKITPLQKAVIIIGTQDKLAKILGVKQPYVWNWIHRDKKVPAEYVIRIEKATNGLVTRHDLRPDIYPLE